MSSESDEVRVWLVERGYNNRDLIILKYATPEGDQVNRKKISSQALETVTAAKDVSPDDLETVENPDVRERYADEVGRMANNHDPNESV